MTVFTVLHVRRSDGKLETINRNGKPERNGPTDEQLDSTPDAKGVADYYREIQPDELKHLDWRRKLAGMFMRHIGTAGDPNNGKNPYIFNTLPHNYRLYEHIKSKGADPEGKPAGIKTHAGGGHDRQDAYLYGHPDGRKKRYRSPADFFPHLLWLCTDEEGDPENCACKICAPDEIQPDYVKSPNVLRKKKKKSGKQEKPELEKSIKKETADTDKKPDPKQAAYASAPPNKPNANKLSQTGVLAAGTATAKNTTTAGPVAQRVSTPQQLIASALPQPSSFDQKVDLEAGRFTFRNGELVWFRRAQETWGLAVIVRRWLSNGKAGYMVEALSYPNGYLAPTAVDVGSDMRPFLAWSPPPYIHEALRHPNITFDNADWLGLTAPALSSGTIDNTLVIDASILAARKIEGSYTLLEPGVIVKKEVNIQIRRWNGMYLGAEKIWVGDPVRIRTSIEDVFVVHHILERITSGTSYYTNTTVTLMGERWTAREAPPGSALPPAQPNMPIRMSKDLEYRNAFAATAGQPQVYWELLDKNKTFELSNVRGRWYESSMLLPILDTPAEFAVSKAAGRVGSSNIRLNHRGESIGSNRANVRKGTREEAFARAVPASTRIVTGTIDPPLPNELAPQPQQTQQAQQPPQTAQSHQPSHHHDELQTGSFGSGEPTPEQTMDDLVNFDHLDLGTFGGPDPMFGGL